MKTVVVLEPFVCLRYIQISREEMNLYIYAENVRDVINVTTYTAPRSQPITPKHSGFVMRRKNKEIYNNGLWLDTTV